MNVKNTRASKSPREIVRQFPGLTQSFTLYTIILFCTTFSCVETASAEATRKLQRRTGSCGENCSGNCSAEPEAVVKTAAETAAGLRQ